jgi:hypothetical protein
MSLILHDTPMNDRFLSGPTPHFREDGLNRAKPISTRALQAETPSLLLSGQSYEATDLNLLGFCLATQHPPRSTASLPCCPPRHLSASCSLYEDPRSCFVTCNRSRRTHHPVVDRLQPLTTLEATSLLVPGRRQSGQILPQARTGTLLKRWCIREEWEASVITQGRQDWTIN